MFDARLLAAVIARGAVFRRHSVRALTRTDGGLVLDDSISARVVIGADGAESAVRRLAGVPANRVGHVALAVRGYAPELSGQGGAQLLTMTENRWPAYAWSFPLGNGTANVGYGEVLTRAPVSRAELVARMHQLLPGVEPSENRGHRLPLSTGRPQVPAGRVLLVGDAHSLIDPLSGEGIYYAIRSGRCRRRRRGRGGRRRSVSTGAYFGDRLIWSPAAADPGRRSEQQLPSATWIVDTHRAVR